MFNFDIHKYNSSSSKTLFQSQRIKSNNITFSVEQFQESRINFVFQTKRGLNVKCIWFYHTTFCTNLTARIHISPKNCITSNCGQGRKKLFFFKNIHDCQTATLNWNILFWNNRFIFFHRMRSFVCLLVCSFFRFFLCCRYCEFISTTLSASTARAFNKRKGILIIFFYSLLVFCM